MIREGRINLSGMVFYGYHGVLAAERELGQRFIVDLTLYLSLEQASGSDDLKHTVDYREIYQLVQEIVEGQAFNLLEALAGKIIRELLAREEKINGVWVRIKKPSVPIPGALDAVSVELEGRSQS